MRVTNPKTIQLTATNVADTTESEWLTGTTYNINDLVKVTLEEDAVTARQPHRIYKSLTGSNSGNYPPDDTTNWEDQGATNRWKMFDDYVSSQTTNATTIDITLTATKVDKLYLFNLDATSVQIICKEADTTLISDETVDLTDSYSGSWSEYFFTDAEYRTVLIYDLPGYFIDMTIQVIIAKTGTVKCGHCVVGKSIEIGKTQYGVNASIVDYSTKTTNTFGETEFVQRSYAKTADVDLWIDHDTTGAEYDRIHRVLSLLRATPCVWDANNYGSNRSSFVIYGFFKDFDLIANYAIASHCSLTIEGLI